MKIFAKTPTVRSFSTMRVQPNSQGSEIPFITKQQKQSPTLHENFLSRSLKKKTFRPFTGTEVKNFNHRSLQNVKFSSDIATNETKEFTVDIRNLESDNLFKYTSCQNQQTRDSILKSRIASDEQKLLYMQGELEKLQSIIQKVKTNLQSILDNSKSVVDAILIRNVVQQIQLDEIQNLGQDIDSLLTSRSDKQFKQQYKFSAQFQQAVIQNLTQSNQKLQKENDILKTQVQKLEDDKLQLKNQNQQLEQSTLKLNENACRQIEEMQIQLIKQNEETHKGIKIKPQDAKVKQINSTRISKVYDITATVLLQNNIEQGFHLICQDIAKALGCGLVAIAIPNSEQSQFSIHFMGINDRKIQSDSSIAQCYFKIAQNEMQKFAKY